mmetsp:Transcript_6535/g.16274  ORF Transcript_6535/g.16274 Transcript_6535/m.16274 type:complete len:222 (-) Transcript_6535:101-766(-)
MGRTHAIPNENEPELRGTGRGDASIRTSSGTTCVAIQVDPVDSVHGIAIAIAILCSENGAQATAESGVHELCSAAPPKAIPGVQVRNKNNKNKNKNKNNSITCRNLYTSRRHCAEAIGLDCLLVGGVRNQIGGSSRQSQSHRTCFLLFQHRAPQRAQRVPVLRDDPAPQRQRWTHTAAHLPEQLQRPRHHADRRLQLRDSRLQSPQGSPAIAESFRVLFDR